MQKQVEALKDYEKDSGLNRFSRLPCPNGFLERAVHRMRCLCAQEAAVLHRENKDLRIRLAEWEGGLA